MQIDVYKYPDRESRDRGNINEGTWVGAATGPRELASVINSVSAGVPIRCFLEGQPLQNLDTAMERLGAEFDEVNIEYTYNGEHVM